MRSLSLPLSFKLLILGGLGIQALEPRQQQKPLGSLSPPLTSSLFTNAELQLRHIFQHGGSQDPDVHRRLDILPTDILLRSSPDISTQDTRIEQQEQEHPRYQVNIRSGQIQRPNHDVLESETNERPHEPDGTQTQGWTLHDIREPDVADKSTVMAFARMANDAYYLKPGSGDWIEVGGPFNRTYDFGWESDGLRGHVFADESNATVVVALKGTSAPFVDPRATISNDKINDNLLFSCCCGQGGGLWGWWNKVCNCATATRVGNTTCLRDEIREKTRYYRAAVDVYRNISHMYPDADVWLSGHSLGGSIASLLGLTVGVPVVTFEAPADAMAAARLGLPVPPGLTVGNDSDHRFDGTRSATPVYHFYHTADDIPMGRCNAWDSICTLGGYAMESRCHTGSICVYDTIKDLNLSANARGNHAIDFVINQVIDTYDTPAKCVPERQCLDCDGWKFF